MDDWVRFPNVDLAQRSALSAVNLVHLHDARPLRHLFGFHTHKTSAFVTFITCLHLIFTMYVFSSIMHPLNKPLGNTVNRP